MRKNMQKILNPIHDRLIIPTITNNTTILYV
jgi:hypothetical protein